MSNPFLQSHLVHGLRFEEDPEFRSTPLRRFPYRKHPGVLRRAWRTYTGAWSYGSFQMRYSGLDPNARYRLRIVYPPTVSDVNLHLTANNGVEVHASLPKQDPPLPREFDLPPQATQNGQLVPHLARRCEPGRESGHARSIRGLVDEDRLKSLRLL